MEQEMPKKAKKIILSLEEEYNLEMAIEVTANFMKKGFISSTDKQSDKIIFELPNKESFCPEARIDSEWRLLCCAYGVYIDFE